MKERDYINVTDLARVMDAEGCLQHITPENSIPAITIEDSQTVHRILQSWREALFLAISDPHEDDGGESHAHIPF